MEVGELVSVVWGGLLAGASKKRLRAEEDAASGGVEGGPNAGALAGAGDGAEGVEEGGAGAGASKKMQKLEEVPVGLLIGKRLSSLQQ